MHIFANDVHRVTFLCNKLERRKYRSFFAHVVFLCYLCIND